MVHTCKSLPNSVVEMISLVIVGVLFLVGSLQNSVGVLALSLFSSTTASAASDTDKTIVVLVDLRRESECNRVENYVAIEATEVGRQRAEAAQWTFERIKNRLNNRQTSLSLGNSVFLLPLF